MYDSINDAVIHEKDTGFIRLLFEAGLSTDMALIQSRHGCLVPTAMVIHIVRSEKHFWWVSVSI